MKDSTKYVLIGVGVLALVGFGLYASAQSRRRQEMQQQKGGELSQLASSVLEKISGSPEAQQQRLANRKLRQSTKQAKLLKRGKITVEDLSALQNI